jgi:hypothetical protein
MWIGAAFTFMGVALSALVVFVEFPQGHSSIPAGARGVVAAIGIAAVLVFVICLIGYGSQFGRVKREAEDICDEMDNHAGVNREPSQGGERLHRRLRFRWLLRRR